ncbi:unnamed protein product [Amoebophrya sp. A25]|nr:unnamed protein product [Amoebophrya sp. A25]|eukprot:GSA25T00023066001.1
MKSFHQGAQPEDPRQDEDFRYQNSLVDSQPQAAIASSCCASSSSPPLLFRQHIIKTWERRRSLDSNVRPTGLISPHQLSQQSLSPMPSQGTRRARLAFVGTAGGGLDSGGQARHGDNIFIEGNRSEQDHVDERRKFSTFSFFPPSSGFAKAEKSTMPQARIPYFYARPTQASRQKERAVPKSPSRASSSTDCFNSPPLLWNTSTDSQRLQRRRTIPTGFIERPRIFFTSRSKKAGNHINAVDEAERPDPRPNDPSSTIGASTTTAFTSSSSSTIGASTATAFTSSSSSSSRSISRVPSPCPSPSFKFQSLKKAARVCAASRLEDAKRISHSCTRRDQYASEQGKRISHSCTRRDQYEIESLKGTNDKDSCRATSSTTRRSGTSGITGRTSSSNFAAESTSQKCKRTSTSGSGQRDDRIRAARSEKQSASTKQKLEELQAQCDAARKCIEEGKKPTSLQSSPGEASTVDSTRASGSPQGSPLFYFPKRLETTSSSSTPDVDVAAHARQPRSSYSFTSSSTRTNYLQHSGDPCGRLSSSGGEEIICTGSGGTSKTVTVDDDKEKASSTVPADVDENKRSGAPSRSFKTYITTRTPEIPPSVNAVQEPVPVPGFSSLIQKKKPGFLNSILIPSSVLLHQPPKHASITCSCSSSLRQPQHPAQVPLTTHTLRPPKNILMGDYRISFPSSGASSSMLTHARVPASTGATTTTASPAGNLIEVSRTLIKPTPSSDQAPPQTQHQPPATSSRKTMHSGRKSYAAIPM